MKNRVVYLLLILLVAIITVVVINIFEMFRDHYCTITPYNESDLRVCKDYWEMRGDFDGKN